jgi:DinB family protein
MAEGNEGWEWTRIQRDPCPQCGQHPASLPPPALSRLAIGAADAWRRFLATEDREVLRRYPAPDVWSSMEYGAHVRDMYRVFGERIVRAVEEDDPVVPWFDHYSAAQAEGSNDMNPLELGAKISREADNLARIIDERSPGDWSRTARRDGTDAFTVAGLACFGVHEAHHHLLDANGTFR